MKKIIRNLLAVFLFFLFCTPAFPQDFEKEKTNFSVTPRVWFAYTDLPAEDYTSVESFWIPMYGATVTVSPSSTPNFSFLLTALTGDGDGDAAVTYIADPAELEADRTDVELLVRYAIPEMNSSLYFGYRYVTFDQTLKVPSFSFSADTDSNLHAIELGLGTTANITESGRHRIFGNFTFGLTFSDWDYKDTDGFSSSGNDTSPMIDFNAGYQYSVSEHFSFSIRYRLFAYMQDTEFKDDVFQDKLVAIHGPELGLTWTF